MRLLNTQTLQLHEFWDEAIPPYAILSHTWEKDEVSFQEIQCMNSTTMAKQGYHKIKRCCEIAAADGFEYAWIDTCCIDKTSSAELSEAINSMYKWYRNSQVCFVYLSDLLDAHHSGTGFIAGIKKCRWFTRGWTLQELIAPRNVIFLNSSWEDIGTKMDLSRALSSITDIHEEVLQGESVKTYSLAQRMSWASRRETTRTEDIAYCLLGIFGVHMPMLYGEGSQAFVRLQEEIMKKSSDHSLLAWKPQVGDKYRAVQCIVADSPKQFVDSGNVCYYSMPCFGAPGPFVVTKEALYVELLTATQAGEFIALLDCIIGNEKNNPLALKLRANFGSQNGDFHVVGLTRTRTSEHTWTRRLLSLTYQTGRRYIVPKLARVVVNFPNLDGIYLIAADLGHFVDTTSMTSIDITDGVVLLSGRVGTLRFQDSKGNRFHIFLRSDPYTPMGTGVTVAITADDESLHINPSTRLPLLHNEPSWSERLVWKHYGATWIIKIKTKRQIMDGNLVSVVTITSMQPPSKEI